MCGQSKMLRGAYFDVQGEVKNPLLSVRITVFVRKFRIFLDQILNL